MPVPACRADTGSMQLFTCETPFSQLTDYRIPMLVRSGGRPPKPTGLEDVGFTEDLWELMQRGWDADPDVRPPLSDFAKPAGSSSPLRGLHALLIGIKRYPHVGPLAGVSADLSGIERHLLRGGARREDVHILRDEAATRKNILSAVQAHLLRNDSIQPGDPVLLYFSGYGSRVRNSSHEDELCIVPYDSIIPLADLDRDSADHSLEDNIFMDSNGDLHEVQFAMPTRTLGRLLRKIEEARGANVLAVFDCSHAASTPHVADLDVSAFQRRSLDARYLRVLPARLDEIWGVDDALDVPPTPYFVASPGITFLAASDKEHAWGDSSGGLFTRALLAALEHLRDAKDLEFDHRSLLGVVVREYTSFLQAAILLCFDRNIPKIARPEMQHPLIEGSLSGYMHHPLLLRKSWFAVRAIPPALPAYTTYYNIGVGSDMGVETDFTLFDICAPLHQGRRKLLTRAVASLLVLPSSCLATLHPDEAKVLPPGTTACVSTSAAPVRVAYKMSAHPSRASDATLSALSLLGLGIDASEASAHALLEIGPEGDVAVRGLHSCLRDFDELLPRIAREDVAKAFPTVLSWMARFYQLLALDCTGPDDGLSLAGLIDFGLHILPPDLDVDPLPLPGPLGPGMPFQNGKATISNAPDIKHAIVLHNRSFFALYPYVMLLEPSTYEIKFGYHPTLRTGPPLRSGGTLQLGRSLEHCEPWHFHIPQGMTRNMYILKVFLSTTPLNLAPMEQKAVLSLNESGKHNWIDIEERTADSSGMGLMKGTWMAFTRWIVVE
jgi:hypothetical protein